MSRGFPLRLVAALSGAVVLASFASPPVAAAGNAGILVRKSVDPAQVTINPNIGVTLAVDKATAIPADRLTYTAVVTNPTATLAMGGDINAEAHADADATVAYYWDELEVCALGCGNGIGNPNWKAVAAFVATQPGYQPVQTPSLNTGMSLSVQPVTRNGVVYPTSGDLVLGTVISPSATAAWTYLARVVLSPAQIKVLSDPTQVQAMRNVIHMEVTVRNTSAAQPWTDPELFTNPFTTTANPGAIANVTVKFTLPDGTSVQVPATSSLAPGGSATATATFKVPVPAARGASETEAAYVARLHQVDGSALTATAVAAGSGFSGTVYATSSPVTTNEFVPIVVIAKSGPTSIDAGATETNPLALQNVGGAAATSLAITDTVPGSPNGSVSGTPASLAPNATGGATATFPVPVSQAEGSLTDTASVTWHDGNGNSYGPLSSSFTTNVHNVLFGADLSLAPVTAGPNPTGSTQTLTATLIDRHSNPIPNQSVTFTITGANPGTGSATTNASGKALFTYTGNNPGNDTAIANVVAPFITLTSNTASISWGKPLQPVVTTQVQGNFYPNPNNNCFFSATGTPAFGQSFPDILFNADPSVIPHDISSINPFTRPFTDKTVDVNGNYNGQIVAQGNGFQAGTGPLFNFFAAFTGSFIVNQAGDVTFTIIHDDAYILGVGNGATRVNGDLEGNVPTTTAFNGYGVVAGFNQIGNAAGSATVHFPAPGTYPYEIDYTECAGGGLQLVLETAKFIAQTDPLSIYVGYADGLRAGGSVFPFPWQGSPGVTFIGGCTFDAGTIRFDNSGNTDITLDHVTVDLGNGGPHFDIWPANLVVPAHGILILTQTGCFNFDTSDFSGSPCGQSNGVLPLVNVTRGGVLKTFTDTNQVLNTHGYDSFCQGNESIPWQRIAGQANTVNVPLPPAVMLDLMPFNIPNAVQGQTVSVTVSALDSAGNPQVNLAVTLQVFGVNAQNLTANTNTSGLATFSYPGNFAGADALQASAFISGQRALSNQGSVVWSPPGGSNNPLGATITNTSPADGSVITKPVAVDATIAAPAGHTITSWRVFYQAAAGGPVVQIGGASGAPPSPLGVSFDPTVLANGAYTVTVEATTDSGVIQAVNSGVSVFGGLKLGRYSTTFQDMAVPVTGVQLAVQRTYDSIDTAASGDFGFGWHVAVTNFRESSNRTLGAGGWTQYNKSCTFGLCFTAFRNAAPRFVAVTYPDGHVEIFDFTPTGGTNVFWSCAPNFTARSSVGTTSMLIPLDDTACSYIGDGNIYGSGGSAYNPQRFQLTTRDGRVIVLDHKAGLISLTDRNGNRLTVDANGVHASNGQGILFSRDGSGRIAHITGPAGQTVTYTYSGSGDLASSTDPIGNVNTYTYDGGHHLLKVTGPQGALSTQTFDSSGRLITITDAQGHATQIHNNVGAQSVVYTDATGATTTTLISDDLGNVIEQDVSSAGTILTTHFAFDSVGHMTQETDALGNTAKAFYDSAGNVVRYTDRNGNSTQMTYDRFGDLTSAIGPDGSILQSVTYDANGNPTSVLGPSGTALVAAYDSAGRQISRTDAAGNITSFAYDAAGHMVKATDPGGMSATFTYDVSGRLASSTDLLGNTTSYTYDAADNLVRQTDARAASVSLTYNSFGLVTSATDALGKTTTANYDADGRLVSVTDRAGNTTTYSHDADGRLTRIDYPGGEFIAWSLDGFGRPTSSTNSSSILASTYDALGRVVTSTITSSAFGSVSLSYTYDAVGNRLTSTGPDGTVNYAYDSLSRIVKVIDPRSGVFGIQYDAAGRVVGLSRPNGVSDAYSYNSDGRLVGATSSRNGTALQTISESVDANGQVTSLTDATGTMTFKHDADGRLVGVSGPGGVAQAYTYDPVGNRTSGPTASSSNTFNLADEQTSDVNFNYTYDSYGQRVTKTDKVSGATTHYVYNGLHQLISIQYPDGTSTSYTYDPLGRRLTVSHGGATTGYVYDGVSPRLEYGSGSLVASYVSTKDVDRPLEMTRAGNSYYYLQDLAGSVSKLTDSSGSVAASYSYDPFGVPGVTSGSVTNPFTFTGREFDANSRLYYDRARYYDPANGTFLSADPIAAGPPYAYAANDPVDFKDPSGAQFAGIAKIYQWVASKAEAFKAIACTVVILSTMFEVLLDKAEGVDQDLLSIFGGVAVGCLFSLASPTSGTSLLLAPFLSGLVAGFIDWYLQSKCTTRPVDPTHYILVGAAALLVSGATALMGSALPDNADAVQKLTLQLGQLLYGVGVGSNLDYLTNQAPCPKTP